MGDAYLRRVECAAAIDLPRGFWQERTPRREAITGNDVTAGKDFVFFLVGDWLKLCPKVLIRPNEI